MFRGPHRTCVAPNAGCVEILGTRSNAASAEAPADAVDGEIGRDDLSEDVKSMGRRGASDVNVLQLISFEPARRGY